MGEQDQLVPDGEAELEPLAPEELGGGPGALRPVVTRSAAESAAQRGKKVKKTRRTIALYQRYPALFRLSAVVGFVLLLVGTGIAVKWSLDAGHAPLKVAMIALGFGGVCGVVGKLLPAIVVYLGLLAGWLLLFGGMLGMAFAAFLAACLGLNALGL